MMSQRQQESVQKAMSGSNRSECFIEGYLEGNADSEHLELEWELQW